MVTKASPVAVPPLIRLGRWADRIGLSRKLAIALTVAALASGLATYGALSGSGPLDPDAQTVLILLNVDLVLVLVLSAVVLRRLVGLWIERRRGSAGSRLHTRLAALFSVVAVAPAIIVAVFSVLFLNLGVEGMMIAGAIGGGSVSEIPLIDQVYRTCLLVGRLGRVEFDGRRRARPEGHVDVGRHQPG